MRNTETPTYKIEYYTDSYEEADTLARDLWTKRTSEKIVIRIYAKSQNEDAAYVCITQYCNHGLPILKGEEKATWEQNLETIEMQKHTLDTDRLPDYNRGVGSNTTIKK